MSVLFLPEFKKPKSVVFVSGSPLHGGRWLTFLPLESLFPRWLPFSLEAFPGRWAVCSVGTIGAGRVGGPGCPVDPQLPHWLVERSASSGRRCRLSRAYGRAAGLSRTLIVPQLTGPRAADPLPSPLQRWDCGGGGWSRQGAPRPRAAGRALLQPPPRDLPPAPRSPGSSALFLLLHLPEALVPIPLRTLVYTRNDRTKAKLAC